MTSNMTFVTKATLLRILLATLTLSGGSSGICKLTQHINHGRVDYTTYFATGNAKVVCDEGYVAEPSPTMSCRFNVWSRVECILHVQGCLQLVKPENGSVTYLNQSTTYGAVADYSCDEGFMLNGTASRICLTSGDWSDASPHCYKTDCLNIDLTNGNVTYIPDTGYQSTASITCNEGYYSEGNLTPTCLANGNWSGPDPICRVLDCGELDVLINGMVIYPAHNTVYQAKALYVCNEGFTLQGNTVRECRSNATWSGEMPTCVKDGDTTSYDVLIIFGVIFVVVAITVAGLTVYIRWSGKVCLTKKVDNSDFEQLNIEIKVLNKFRPTMIKRNEFPAFVDVLHKECGRLFADGFRLLEEESPSHPTTVAESKACKSKTRFSNSLPFDVSRVKLEPIEDEEGSDFINANFIPEYRAPKQYIATQGPTPETKNDFWRMVWEYDVDIIVMLTKRLETGKGSLPRNYTAERHWVVPLCDQYWPDEVQGPVYYGKLIVNTTSETVLTDYVTRVMEVTLGEETRTLTQIHYLRWPEHGCPKRHWPFINFVTTVRQYLPRQMVVHCSTGIGRTGTFIAVDRLLQHINENEEVDVYSVILDMRNYRSNMVKTLEQFIYIFDCLKHFITLEEDQEDEEDDARQYAFTENGTSSFNNRAFQKGSIRMHELLDIRSSTTTPSKKTDNEILLQNASS